jgi:uncharacterized membrane protein
MIDSHIAPLRHPPDESEERRIEGTGLKLDRLLALADGTLAIVITLLVLLLEPPPPHLSQGDVVKDVLAMGHYFAAYVMSFMLVGIYWLGHHGLFHHIRRGNLTLVWLNLVFLMCVAFVPFPTALLVEYPKDRMAAVVYGLAQLLCSSSLGAIWFYAVRRRRLVSQNLSREIIVRTSLKLGVGPVVYLLSILAAFQHRGLSLLLYALVPVGYLILDRTQIYQCAQE